MSADLLELTSEIMVLLEDDSFLGTVYPISSSVQLEEVFE